MGRGRGARHGSDSGLAYNTQFQRDVNNPQQPHKHLHTSPGLFFFQYSKKFQIKYLINSFVHFKRFFDIQTAL